MSRSYKFNDPLGTSRWDKRKLRMEFFEFDDLDRLEQAQVYTTNSSGGLLFTAGPLTYGYDGSVGGTTMGNLKQRTDIGKFGTTAVHRIAQATGPDYPFPFDDPPIEPVQGFLEDGSTRLFSVQAKPKNDGVAVPTGSFFGEAWAEKRPGAASEEILDMLSTITPGPQAITYTSYHQPASLSETIDGTSYLLEYTYDADQQRNYSKLRNMTAQSTVEERWYEHGLETQRLNGNPSTDRKILYVQGGDGLCAMIVAEPGGAQTAYAVYKDHLGSIVAVTKHTFSPELLGGGSSGPPEILAEQNFDAWGRKRNPTTWAYTGVPEVPTWLYRGYTGHEHMEHFSLINVNAMAAGTYQLTLTSGTLVKTVAVQVVR